MIKKQTLGLFALLICIGFSTTQAQNQLHIRNGCNFYGEETETAYYQFEPNNEAQQIVNELLQGSGLSGSSFLLKESNCKNALATTVGDTRYILYNPDFLRKFKQDANTKWAAYGALAHEIGHHLNGHNLSETNPLVRKRCELEADKFAGNLLFHLHATVEQAQAVIQTIPLEGESKTHPSKTARLVATTNGWTAAYDLNRGIQPTVDNEKLAKEWFEKCVREIDLNKQIEYYTRAIELKPNYAKAFNSRGVVKQELRRYKEALLDYDQAVKFDPKLDVAYANKGCCLIAMNDKSLLNEAINLINRGLALAPSPEMLPWAKYCKSEALKKLKE
jgi:tetratricopeptide (TPR) repeat protein